MATLESLEKRIQFLEDLEAIKKMKAYYGHLCDERYGKGKDELKALAEKITNLFTDDAVWDGGPKFGIQRGRKEIYDYFANPAINFGLHFFVKPNLTIEGNKANGRWYLLMPGTTKDNTPFWLAGFEDDEYVKKTGQWLHSYMKMIPVFFTPYDEGWVKQKLIS